ncbi:MAG: DUF72 domain-containing protein [Acidobacteriota bacterium]|nr:DUF72 domain-containing protein [Acidobacteriota bacterium]
MAEIRIGTSGWHYKHWVGRFYPEGWPASKMLAYYRERFDTVEINNSFYCLPVETALETWRASTPDHFLFALKGSRFLTHMKKLTDPAAGIEKFFARADLLQEKLGPILFQLPPRFAVKAERLEAFIEALPKWHRYAFEFRDESWNTAEVYRTLRKHNVAYCAFHLAGFQSPIEITADIAYVRLHGPGGKYQGSYSDDALREWARRIDAWRRDLKAIYVYFDNDDSGFAAFNALRLRELTLRS